LAKAWSYVNGNWASLSVPSGSPTWEIELLTDVAVLGSNVYAVGHRNTDSLLGGVVLKYDGQEFDEFAGPYDPSDIAHCPHALGPLTMQVLTKVEFSPSGHVWVVGTCGRIWEYQTSLQTPAWREHKSQTIADIRGMSFVTSDRGYVAGHGGGITNQVVERDQEP
jgi:hypothetical protein